MLRIVKIFIFWFNFRNYDFIKDRDNFILIILVFCYVGKWFVWSIKEKVWLRFWDKKCNWVKIIVNNLVDVYINIIFNDYVNKVIDIFWKYDGDISVLDFKEELNIIIGRKKWEVEEVVNIFFLEFIDYYVELRKSDVNSKWGIWKIL